jgi:hypothetical protein
MLYPLSYEGQRTKALVRGHEIVAGWSHGSHLIILGRGLAAAYWEGNVAEAQVTGVGHGCERRFGGPLPRLRLVLNRPGQLDDAHLYRTRLAPSAAEHSRRLFEGVGILPEMRINPSTTLVTTLVTSGSQITVPTKYSARTSGSGERAQRAGRSPWMLVRFCATAQRTPGRSR